MKKEKSEYVYRYNTVKTMWVWNEMDAFEKLTDEQKAILMLIQENTRLKEEIEELKRKLKEEKTYSTRE